MKLLKKIATLSITFAFVLMLTAGHAYAAGIPAQAGGGGVPYKGFSFNYWGLSVPSPAAYVPAMTIGGLSIEPSVGHFNMPEDMYVDKNEIIYVMDTGNNRLVVFNKDMQLINVFDSFMRDGERDSFNRPMGVFVTDDLDIYIADTENKRIVVLTNDGELIKIIENPEFDELEDQFEFIPTKVCVDRAGRVYAIVRNVYEGLMSFDANGNFMGYFGTIEVNYSRIDWVWRQLSTSVQRSRQRLFIPVEFSSMCIDHDGFIYTTNLDVWEGNKVKRLNPSGEDVLINYTELDINGDQYFRMMGRLGGPARFVAIKSRPFGMYSALDSARGRLFTYDSEGNMLYVIGGTGNTLGMATRPVAVETLGGSILILDRHRGEIVYYQETEYGRLINEAVGLRFDGDESAAVDNWRRVLELNENFNLAYSGIGKSLLAAGQNREAMSYLQKGMNVEHYAIAFRRYRNEVLRDNMQWIFTLGFVLIAGYVTWKAIRRRKSGKVSEGGLS
jgi:DNA-binding beta-propeller fold protein YncE